jgi:hypothetical protein
MLKKFYNVGHWSMDIEQTGLFFRSADGQKQRLQLHVLRLLPGPQGLEGKAAKVSKSQG